MATATQPAQLVIFFMENHTADNLCSDVAGVDGDTSLAQAGVRIRISRTTATPGCSVTRARCVSATRVPSCRSCTA